MSEDEQKRRGTKHPNQENGLETKEVAPPDKMDEETSVVTTLPLPWYEDQVKVGRVVPGYTGMVNSHGETVGMYRVPSHEILSKIYQNLDILLKKPNFGTYSPISLNSLHLF